MRLTPMAVVLAALALMACSTNPGRVDGDVADMHAALQLERVELPPPDDVPPPAVTLGPGDVLRIDCAGVPDAEETCRIGVDGRLYYGPIAGIEATGMTVPDVQAALTRQLATYIRHPQPLVELTEQHSRTVTVLGRVNTPGVVRLRGGERVLDLLTATGGLMTSRFSGSTEDLADLSGARYIRNGDVLPLDLTALVERGDQRFNIQVHPNDYLYVPSRLSREVYVVGAVGQPRAMGYRDNLTVARAIAQAEGFMDQAQPRRVILIRGSTAQPMAARVDALAIIEGYAPDVPLAPRDIIFVPGRDGFHPAELGDFTSRVFTASAAGRYASNVYTALTEDD